MKIKKGDKVIVIAGADKGKTGVVQKVYPRLDRVVVEGVNVHKKHKNLHKLTQREVLLISMLLFMLVM